MSFPPAAASAGGPPCAAWTPVSSAPATPRVPRPDPVAPATCRAGADAHPVLVTAPQCCRTSSAAPPPCAEFLRIPPHSFLCHLQFLSLLSVPFPSVSFLEFSPIRHCATPTMDSQ